MINLPYGKCYIVKGASDKLLWLLQDEPNIEVINGKYLYDIADSFMVRPTNYIVFYDTDWFKLPKHLSVPPENLIVNKLSRVFIVLSSWDNSLSNTKLKDIYKTFQSNIYITLDISKDKSLDESLERYVQERLCEGSKSNSDDIQLFKILELDKKYKEYPFALQSFLTDLDSVSYCSHTNSLFSLGGILEELAIHKNYKPIYRLLEYPEVTLNQFFGTPDPIFSTFYKVTSSKGTFKCGGLFYWYCIFYYRYLVKWELPIRDSIRIFFIWVLQSSTVLASTFNPGLHFFKKSDRSPAIYYFRPSPQAIDLFYQDLSESL